MVIDTLEDWYKEMCSKCKCYICISKFSCYKRDADGTCKGCVVIFGCSDYERK